jgi:hypothetical protein
MQMRGLWAGLSGIKLLGIIGFCFSFKTLIKKKHCNQGLSILPLYVLKYFSDNRRVEFKIPTQNDFTNVIIHHLFSCKFLVLLAFNPTLPFSHAQILLIKSQLLITGPGFVQE